MTVTVIHPHPAADLEHDPDVVTSAQICAAANLTYRKLDHWTRAGYLHPTPRPRNATSGTPRTYARTEVAVACLTSQLVDAGLLQLNASEHARRLLTTGTTRIAGLTLHLPEEH